MIRFRPSAALALLGALIACRADQTTGNQLTTSPPTPVLAKTTQWAGGEIEIQSVAFKGGGALPVVTANAETLAIRRVDDSTVAARMPAQAGAYTVRVGAGGYTTTFPPLTLYGFVEETVGPVMSGRVTWVNPGAAGGPLVFSSGDSGGVIVDLTTNAVVGTVPDSITSPDCTMSPGASFRGAGYFVLQGKSGGTCGPLYSWQVYPTLAKQDSSPIYSGLQWYVVAEVAAARWFSDWNNHSYVYDCSAGPCLSRSWVDPSGPTAVTIQTGAERFTWTAQNFVGSGSSTAILDATTLDTAYVLPAAGALESAAASSGGDTMFVVTEDTGGLPNQAWYGTHVAAMRASDGAALGMVSLDSAGVGHCDCGASALALDPERPWLYVATALLLPDSVARPALIVIDRTTWTVLGISIDPNPSAEASDDFRFNAVSVVPNALAHQVQVVATTYGYNTHQHHAAILTFDTP